MAQSKIELILEMKERIRTNLNRAKDAVSQSTKDMQDKLDRLKVKFVFAFAIRMLSNPIVGIINTIGALWVGMRKLGEFAAKTKQLYQEEAAAGTKLAAVMRNTMGARNAEINSIKELATQQQRLGVIGDDIQIAGAQE